MLATGSVTRSAPWRAAASRPATPSRRPPRAAFAHRPSRPLVTRAVARLSEQFRNVEMVAIDLTTVGSLTVRFDRLPVENN